MIRKKEWNEEEVIEFLESAIADLKKGKTEFQGLLAKTTDPQLITSFKELLADISFQIKYFQAELKKIRIKKPS